jgi:hypothetical protein
MKESTDRFLKKNHKEDSDSFVLDKKKKNELLKQTCSTITRRIHATFDKVNENPQAGIQDVIDDLTGQFNGFETKS